MITKTKRMTIPEYRERKEIYELLGYKEVSYKEKGIHCFVKMEIDNNNKYYGKMMNLEHQIYRKGPPFFPIFIFIGLSFALLSTFVILLAQSWRDKTTFDLTTNALIFLLPAFASLLGTVIYTYFYFGINKQIVESKTLSKEEIKVLVNHINEQKR